MNRQVTFVALSIFLILGIGWDSNAQNQPKRCLTDSLYGKLITEYPEIKAAHRRAQRQIEQSLSGSSQKISYREEITIPVVVHVVYRLPSQNISEQQIISQIDALNRDFNLRNGNRFKVQDPFLEVMADVGIEFCLANRDPQGNPTSGIVRTETSVYNIGTDQNADGRTSIHHDELGGSDAWNPDRYLNIWVGELNGYLGFGKYPGAALPGEDGVVIDSKYFGTLGLALANGPFNQGKTTTHEVGHYLNLLHPWGLKTDECQEDDQVDDTPIQSNPNYFCPTSPQYSCNSRDMHLNYMDYSDDLCLALFTEGQKERMMATLQSYRSGLLESNGCSFSSKPAKLTERFKVYYRSSDRRLLIERNMYEDFPVDMKMYNKLGQLIARAENIQQRIYIIDYAVQSSGIYFVEISTDDASVLHKIVAVQP